jgi:hypothetical protein
MCHASKTDNFMNDNTEINQNKGQRYFTIIITLLLTLMSLRETVVIFKKINHTKGYLEGMELVYAMFLIQLPALIHLLVTFLSQLSNRKPISKLIWVELVLFMISVSLHFVLYWVNYKTKL